MASWVSHLIVADTVLEKVSGLCRHEFCVGNIAPDSGYLTEIMGLESFPDWIDYLPEGAIVRKINTMGYMPQKEISEYPFVAMTREEYAAFLNQSTELVIEAIS